MPLLPWKVMRPALALAFLSATVFFTAATSPAPEPEPNPPPEEEDPGPCGDDTLTQALVVTQFGMPLAEGAQISITSGGPQGGTDEEGIDVFVHLEGVRSDAVTVSDLSVRFLDDQGGEVVSHSDAEGGFGCFDGEFRTRELNLTLPISSFELDGMDGTLEVSINIDGTPLELSQSMRY